VLVGERAAYARDQHKVEAGLSLAVVAENRGRGTGTVLSVTPQEVSLDFTVSSAPAAPCAARCLIGLPRPQTVKKVLELCATLGVSELHFVASEQGEKSYQSSTVFEPAELQRFLVKGLEQGGEWRLPKVAVHSHLKKCLAEVRPFAEPVPPHGHGAAIFADTLASPESSVSKIHLVPGASTMVALGPEAGWSEAERLLLLSRGFQSISLGSRVLRVEQALAFLLGQIALLGQG
jgi:16S rRNA (uracil1498-N3)-methyltransferase